MTTTINTTKWKVSIEWQLKGDVPAIERTFNNFEDAYSYYCTESQDRGLADWAEYSAAQMNLTAQCAGSEWKITLIELE